MTLTLHLAGTFLLRGEFRLRSSRFYLLELINYVSQAGDASALRKRNGHRSDEGSPQEFGSVDFETTIECHVALDVHTMQNGVAIVLFPDHTIPS